jgi:hypothetical protein
MMRGTLVAAALAALGVIAVVATPRSRGNPRVASVFSERAPDSVRIRVQVLNGTTTRGLARRATMLLRDRGFDVVETGTVSDPRDTTLVLDLSGHPDWARRVARVLGIARIAARRDSSRYLDIAVVLGTTWRPPAEPFHP